MAFEEGWEYRPQYLYEKEVTARKQKQINDIISMDTSGIEEKSTFVRLSEMWIYPSVFSS